MLKSRWVRPKVATSRATPRKSSTHWPTRACCSSRSRPRKLTRPVPGKGPSERAGQGKQGEQAVGRPQVRLASLSRLGGRTAGCPTWGGAQPWVSSGGWPGAEGHRE